MKTIDAEKRYRHAEMPGVAWRVAGPEVGFPYGHECQGHPDDGFFNGPIGEDFYCDGSCVQPEPTGMVVAVMVGDDQPHVVDPDDLVEIADDDYCEGCGQIGCAHDGRERWG